tara:strand:+ start:358 stop:594 length:237 start_codon:yes stop_codon:yes gene_type:complete
MPLKRKRNPNLSKYDAPLKIQFTKGITDFKRGKIINPYHSNTMQSREWMRGFNTSYYQKLERVKNDEDRRRSEKIHGG